jgi:hypothetical protein
MIKFTNPTFCKTNGQSFWSNVAQDVQVTGLSVDWVNEERDFGELRVYFNTKLWDVNKQGLIYTDQQFMREFKALLAKKFGLNATKLCYSEQGMQGANYVSMDVFCPNLISDIEKLETEMA